MQSRRLGTFDSIRMQFLAGHTTCTHDGLHCSMASCMIVLVCFRSMPCMAFWSKCQISSVSGLLSQLAEAPKRCHCVHCFRRGRPQQRTCRKMYMYMTHHLHGIGSSESLFMIRQPVFQLSCTMNRARYCLLATWWFRLRLIIININGGLHIHH